MRNKYERSFSSRLAASIAALALICGFMVIWLAGMSLYASLAILGGLGVLGGQASSVGESVTECLTGVVVIFLESITGMFEWIGDLFNW